MDKCQQWVQPKDRWSNERQCSRNEKHDTGLCSVHLKMQYKGQFGGMAIMLLEESDYDPRFSATHNQKVMNDYLESNMPPYYIPNLLTHMNQLAYSISMADAKAPATWEWVRSQPRKYEHIKDVNDELLRQSLNYEQDHTRWAMEQGESYEDYDKAIAGFGLDTMPEHDYDSLKIDYEEYIEEKRAYDNEFQKIMGEFRDEQTKLIIDLRERQQKELAGLIVPVSPLE
jgi:hypothetical protein